MLRTAIGCILIALLVWAGAFHVGPAHALDGDVLWVFTRFAGTPVEWLTHPAVQLIDPLTYAALCAGVVAWAIHRHRPGPALTAAVALAGANLTTQILKPALAVPRVHLRLDHQIAAESWPSGHATAAMVLALCAILVVSPERRKIVAVAALGLAALASGAILVEQWHYPSDVLGGYAVAGVWTFGAAALIMPRVRPRESTAAPRRRWLRATG